mmetsp:Transcript_4692/g.9678  ORF Transcript_4692/g.9678 Transcript_4692/m.9678 type:complete len:94 (-) Transcript_4692:174-455(-)
MRTVCGARNTTKFMPAPLEQKEFRKQVHDQHSLFSVWHTCQPLNKRGSSRLQSLQPETKSSSSISFTHAAATTINTAIAQLKITFSVDSFAES